MVTLSQSIEYSAPAVSKESAKTKLLEKVWTWILKECKILMSDGLQFTEIWLKVWMLQV